MYHTLLILIILVILRSCESSYNFDNNTMSSAKKRVVRILVYDRISGFLNWFQDWFKDATSNRCRTKCILSDDKNQLNSADVVLFHAPTHGKDGVRLPSQKPQNSIYVMLSMEQPMYAKVLNDKNYLQLHFDLIATYSMQQTYPGTNIPNLPITYYPLNILAVEAVMQSPRPFAKKTGYGTGVSVVIFASNCHNAGASQRYAFLEELMKHVEVMIESGPFSPRPSPRLLYEWNRYSLCWR